MVSVTCSTGGAKASDVQAPGLADRGLLGHLGLLRAEPAGERRVAREVDALLDPSTMAGVQPVDLKPVGGLAAGGHSAAVAIEPDAP